MALRSTITLGKRLCSNTAAAPVSIRKAAEEATSDATWKHYKIVSFAMIAGCGAVAYSAFSAPHPHLPDYVNYPHMRIRRKAFPWDDGSGASLFHFYTVALPGGENYHPNDHH
eukprot:gene7728-5546_t